MQKITKDHELAASQNPVTENIEKLRQLFPSIVSEDKIDFEALKQLLGDEVTEDEEYFRFVWPGKKQARAEALKPSTGTLRPAPEESLDWETTQNVYIEGDNLEVLKLLQRSYAGKVKMIYIDPPYNTGKDFVYKDNYRDNLANYRENYGRKDEEGNAIATQSERNAESSGRYHSNWLNMMYPRLQLARNLLREDGVIFISIDDNEIENITKIANEIFGEDNFLEVYLWESTFRPDNSSTLYRENAQYVLAFVRNLKALGRIYGSKQGSVGLPSLTKNSMKASKLSFPPNTVKAQFGDGKYLSGEKDSGYILHEDVIVKSGIIENSFSITGRVIWGQNYLDSELEKGTEIIFKTSDFVPYSKKAEDKRLAPETILPQKIVKDVLAGRAEVSKLFEEAIFDHPKPSSLIQYFNNFFDDDNAVILDFFSGSGSTAHAVLNFNSEKNSNRKYILVQLPQATDLDSIAHKAGYHTIAEIGKERIRRVAKKIREEEPEKAAEMDLGFRVFKLDSSNIEAWDPDPDNLENNLFSENIKPDRSEYDLVYEILLKYGLDLSLPIAERTGPDKRHTLYCVGGGALFLCLGSGITRRSGEAILAWAQEIGAENPKVVFRDTGFTSSVEKTNVYEVLRSGGVEDVKSV